VCYGSTGYQKCQFNGEIQNGFQKGHSTSNLSAKIQLLIANALDGDKYVLLASLGLSSAFDLVNSIHLTPECGTIFVETTSIFKCRSQ
jgi:hypothetical protein